MPTDIEYAQLANRVYARTQRNRTPTTGWKELSWLPDSVSGGGFSAGVYQNGNDIVIAYTGTNEGKALDFIAANIPAGGGLPSPQINEAMALYLETRRAHPNANIGFTGHSLGGGLASLMAVFFDRPAVTFDPAPFQASALNPLNLVLYRSWMLGAGMSDAAFSDYVVNFLSEFYRREGSVRSISLEGEILAVLRDQVPTIEGSHQVVPVGTPTLLQGGFAADGRVALHSMTMLAAMLASPALAQAIRAAPQLLEMIFDSRLYDRDPQVSLEPNFIDRLYVAHVTSNATPVLDRFAADIYLVTQAQGSAASDPMQRALMLAAMEYHYFRDPATASQLFDTAGGHLHFRWSDIAADASTLKSPRALAEVVWSLDDNGDVAQAAAHRAQAWHVQAGSSAMSWVDAEGLNDAALGGAQADMLDGGAGSDLLMGLDGADTLIGGQGADSLFGGTGADTLDGGAYGDYLYGGQGNDTYRSSGAFGTDTIIDSGGDGRIEIDGQQLTGADAERSAAGVDFLVRRSMGLQLGRQRHGRPKPDHPAR